MNSESIVNCSYHFPMTGEEFEIATQCGETSGRLWGVKASKCGAAPVDKSLNADQGGLTLPVT
jgi:hypothetical protein